MKTLLFLEQQKTTDHESVPNRLYYLAQELGCGVIAEPYIPFKEDYDFSFLPTDRPVVFYGSINMVKAFNKSSQYGRVKPFCWFDFDEMSCRSYYTHWGKHIVQSNYAFYTFGEIKRLKDDIYNKYGKDNRIFVRPDTNDKAFTGEVVHYERFDSWFELALNWGVGLLQLCIVSSPEKIDAEYRLVVADGKVIGSSMYRCNGCIDKKEGCPTIVSDFVDEVLNTVPWQPAPIYCMDIAIVNDKPKLLEIGEINCAGLYKIDLRPIAKSMIEIAIRDYSSGNGGISSSSY